VFYDNSFCPTVQTNWRICSAISDFFKKNRSFTAHITVTRMLPKLATEKADSMWELELLWYADDITWYKPRPLLTLSMWSIGCCNRRLYPGPAALITRGHCSNHRRCGCVDWCSTDPLQDRIPFSRYSWLWALHCIADKSNYYFNRLLYVAEYCPAICPSVLH